MTSVKQLWQHDKWRVWGGYGNPNLSAVGRTKQFCAFQSTVWSHSQLSWGSVLGKKTEDWHGIVCSDHQWRRVKLAQRRGAFTQDAEHLAQGTRQIMEHIDADECVHTTCMQQHRRIYTHANLLTRPVWTAPNVFFSVRKTSWFFVCCALYDWTQHKNQKRTNSDVWQESVSFWLTRRSIWGSQGTHRWWCSVYP